MKIIFFELSIIFCISSLVCSSNLSPATSGTKVQILPLTDHAVAEAIPVTHNQNNPVIGTETRQKILENREDDSVCDAYSDFTCSSGQCIRDDSECDGFSDCSDGSDESFYTCESFFVFQRWDVSDGRDDCIVPLEAVRATKDIMGEKNNSYITDLWRDHEDQMYQMKDFTDYDKNYTFGCKNDFARGMIIHNGLKDTKITIFDDGEFSTSDDWAVITVIKSFRTNVEILTFERSQYYDYHAVNADVTDREPLVYVNYATDGNLDKKVSSFIIEFPKVRRVTLHANQSLFSDESWDYSWGRGRLMSENREYVLEMQNTGNLLLKKTNGVKYANGGKRSIMVYDPSRKIYTNEPYTDEDNIEKVLWASNTTGKGKGPYQLLMQEDNHLVVYDSENAVIWSTDVYIKDTLQWKKPGFAALQDDGNFVVYDGVWDVMWDSETYDGNTGVFGVGNKHSPKPCAIDKDCPGRKCEDGECKEKK